MSLKAGRPASLNSLGFERFGSARCQVGEAPVWDAGRGCFWWVDIEGRRLHSADIDGAPRPELSCPGRPTAVGVSTDGALVVAVETAVLLFDPSTETWSLIAEVEERGVGRRLNDGKVGPDGCFWVGSMVEAPGRPGSAALFRVRPDGAVERRVEGLQASNGLAWTADGARMMHSDSRGPWIDAWRFDPATGAHSYRRRIADLSEEEGRPDGAAMDMDGVYWSCGVSAGCLNRFDASSMRLAPLPTPPAAPTMCAFGGEGGHTLLITSHSLNAAPSDATAGALFTARVSAPGVPAFLFGAGR